MFAVLYVDGDPAELSEDTPDTVRLVFDTDYGPRHRCRVCGEELTETSDGYETESGESTCADYPFTDAEGETGPHDPERIPLSWCNSAAVHTDESEDSITVSISVGDPRGAFTFTIRRIPDDTDGDLAGRLVMHTPYASDPLPHVELTPLHNGTHVVGTYPTRRLHAA